jgi:hypothetical protein
MWREGLGAYKIITDNKKGYRNHPAIKEFEGDAVKLICRLRSVREEMIKRGYNPKELPEMIPTGQQNDFEWQTLEQQIEILKYKNCKCNI